MNESQNINRRELLKLLAASGGALAAAAFLPGKWAKPVVEGGVLPAHAQQSCSTSVSLTVGSFSASHIYVEFNDPDGVLTGSSVVHFSSSPNANCGVSDSVAFNSPLVNPAWQAGATSIDFIIDSNCIPDDVFVYITYGSCSTNTISLHEEPD